MYDLKQMTVVAIAVIALSCGHAFAAGAVEDCKSREAMEEAQRLADLKSAQDKLPADQYQQEYADILRESRAVKKQCERDPAFVKPVASEQANAD